MPDTMTVLQRRISVDLLYTRVDKDAEIKDYQSSAYFAVGFESLDIS